MARVVYRIPAVRDEEPKKTCVDYIVVERAAPRRRTLGFGLVALLGVLAYQLPAREVPFVLAFAAWILIGVIRRRRLPVPVTIDSTAKAIAWADIVVPFSEIAYPLVDRATNQLVLCKKERNERIVITDGLVDSCDRARVAIARALIAEYASLREMPPMLAILARQLDAVRGPKEDTDRLHAQLRTLPLDNLQVTEDAAVITVRGQFDGLDVLARHTRWKNRAEIIVQRPTPALRHIELLHGDFTAMRSGLVELTHRTFVNGTTNSVAFGRRLMSARVLHDIDRLDLRHVYLWPKEVRIIPHHAFFGLRDSSSRFADVIALAVACARDVT
jgi:hypothetical protein